ncbi:MAG TPA: hypothetical protein PKD96_02370 [Candidatus Absconditabacterales bacterium]|nr:hypothetical protein [Candidatus Absconditabacterales bacterium]HMT27126.1 hypothetical protein [Candidatus Absconditabacterales bacterium]
MNQLLSTILHKFSRYSPLEKTIIIYSFLLFVFFLFVPIISIQPINGANSTIISYLFRIGQDGFGFNSYFSVSSLIVFGTLLVFIARNISFRFKNFLVTLLGLKNSEYLLNVGLLWILTSTLFTLGETVTLLRNEFTYQISLSYGYFFLCILLVLGLAFSLFHTLKQAKLIKGSTSITIMQKHEDERDTMHREQLTSLFKD